MQELADSYSKATELFQKSTQAAELKEYIQGTILKQDNIKIDRGFCFALGTFTASNHNEDYPQGETTMSQFVVFEYLLDLLKIQKEFAVLFQDPAFTQLDVEFFHWPGYNTIK
jgi:hypothetical protein